MDTHRHALAVGLTALLALAQVACGLTGGGAKQTMLTSAEVPSGQGTVQTKSDANGNTELTLDVNHLAPPPRVVPDASVYVVWVSPRGGSIQNVGALVVDNDQHGNLRTVTPFRQFTVTVTPEPSARVTTPTHKPVFTSEVSRAE
jgi:hypothetical protein